MKYLVIAALFALLLLLLYSRLYPYLQFVGKILGAARTMSDTPPPATRTSAATAETKLIRCLGCQTWIPADRAVLSSAGAPAYCSHECVKKAVSGKERKIAG